MNDRHPTFYVAHLRNHRYDSMALTSEQSWAREIIDAWLASSEDEVATTTANVLSDAGVSCVSEIMQGGGTQSGWKPSEQIPSRTAKRTFRGST